MRGGCTIRLGLSSPAGSKASFTASNACTDRSPNIAALNSLRTMPSPCSPLWLPLYSRTSAKHSSAIARMVARSFGSFVFSTGRTCRQPDRGMRIPGAAHAVAREHLLQPRRVVGEVGERHGAVLDEGDRLRVALHRHHDVEAGFAHLRDARLERGVGRAHDRAGIAEIAHRLSSASSRAASVASSSPWNSTMSRLSGSPISISSMVGAIDGNAAPQLDHRAIDQLHRLGVECHQMLRRLHRRAEGGELADADHLARADRVQEKLDRGRERERPFRAHQQPREIERAARPAPARRCCSRPPGAAPAGTAPRSPSPPPRRVPAAARSAPRCAARPRFWPMLKRCCVPSASRASIARTLSAISP